MRKRLLEPAVMLVFGLLIGVIARLLDIYTQLLGEIFSQMAIWILIGTLIAIYSPTKVRAMLNVLPFCLGMLLTYYVTAVITHGVYGRRFIIGWTVFALCSPIMALLTWMTKERGAFSKVIAVGIVAVSVLSSIVMFDRLRLYDVLIDGALVYFLFFKKIDRGQNKG